MLRRKQTESYVLRTGNWKMNNTQIEKLIAKRRVEKYKNKKNLLGIIIFAAVFFFTSIAIFCVESEIELAKLGTASLSDVAYVLLVFLLVVILTAGVSVKSIYEVILINDMAEFRKLKLIGTTSAQLKRILKYERKLIFWRYAIGGAILGAVVGVMIPVQPYLSAIIGSMIASIGVIYFVISCSTAKLVKRIISLKVSDDLDNYRIPKHKRKSNIHGLKRNTESFLGLRYLYVRGGRSVITGLSLTLSFLLSFVILSVVSSFDIEKIVKRDYEHDSQFIISMERGPEEEYTDLIINSPYSDELERKILDIKGIDKIVKYRLLKMNFECSDENFNLCNGDVNVENAKDDSVVPIVINKGAYWYQNGSVSFQTGDVIESIVHCGNVDKKVSLVVNGFIDDPYDLNIYYTSDNNLDTLTDICCDCKWYVCVNDATFTKDTERMMKSIVDGNDRLRIEVFSEYYEQLKGVFENVKIAIYVICVIVCLFTFINLFDLSVNNIDSRKKDIGIYRTLGMSVKQVVALNYIEIGILIILSGFCGIVLGTPIGKILCKTLADLTRSNYIKYVFPTKYCFIYISAIIIIAYIMKSYIKEYINKVSIVDNIYR